MKIQPVVQAYLWRCLIDLSFIHGGISTVFANFFWARRNQRTESIVTSKLCEVFILTNVRYICYYIRLEEGEPPEHYCNHLQLHWKAHDWLKHYLDEHRQKYIPNH